MLAHQIVPSLLRDVLHYEHPALIERLRQELEISMVEADQLFADTKKFLVLCGTADERLAPSPRIDECWHRFLLFTRDYAEFCQRFFGRFIHHQPKTSDETAGSDGSPIRMTLERAREAFGDALSANWAYRGATCLSDCTRCSGSTNCHN